MEKYSVDANRERIIYRPMNDDWKIETPDEFKDLKVVRVRPYDGNIMVEGCFDHYVYMRFLGVGFLKKHHQHQGIELSWGEHTGAGKEMLWVKK